MNLLLSTSTDPYWNLATEEYLLKNSRENFIFIYRNQPCVVVGKHQNTLKEINTSYILKNKILVARRLSGGGAVYHDEENINFSFIQTISPGENLSYKAIIDPVTKFLKQLFPEIIFSDRNDLILHGKKISGSAMHVFKDRVLAHGTLLVNCNLTHLTESLHGHTHRYTDRAISSKRAEIMNLSELDKMLTADTLFTKMKDFFESSIGFDKLFAISDTMSLRIHELVILKYNTEDWIFGYSPKYSYQNSFAYGKKIIDYTLEVEKGIIKCININSKDELTPAINHILSELVGEKHNSVQLTSFIISPETDSFEIQLLTSLF